MTISQQALAALQPPPGAPASAWATRISACWQASLKAILEVGRLLAAAKEALPHGTFGRMIESDLPFTARTAQMLMAISSDPRITNPKHVSHLPASWGTLYEITKLDDKAFEEKIADGTIRPDMMRREIASAAQAEGHSIPHLPSNSRVVAPTRVEPKDSRDYAPTPPWGTRVLPKLILPAIGVMRVNNAWEPACGEGHIAEVLIEFGISVIASDLFEYGYGEHGIDFLSDRPFPIVPRPDWIITNPPFNKAEEFALLALARATQGVAMFVRWQWIEGVNRYENLFSKYPPTLVCPFAERVPLHMGRWEPEGDTMTAYCWVVWHLPLSSVPTSTRLFWIPPGQRKALTRPDDADRFTSHPVIKAKRDSAGTILSRDSDGVVREAAE